MALRHVDRIVLSFGGKRYAFSIRKELKIIQSENASHDLRHAERFAFWRRVLVEKTRARREMERQHSDQRAEARVQIPDLLKRAGQPKTEEQIHAHVNLQKNVQEFRDRLDDALYEEDLARMMCEAFDHRRTILMKVPALRK